MAEDRIVTSRIGRAATMGGVAAGVAARSAGGKVVSKRTTSDARKEAVLRQQLKAARSIVKMLGGMRGAAMKVGQTLSTVDLGLVHPAVRDEFQEILAELQQGAEPVSYKAIVKVVETELGGKLSKTFTDVDPEPLAAASIGQVHRATLRGGREVVLKVQYPGIAEAVHADMRNVGLCLKLLNAIAPGIDSKAVADELRLRISEELDYELEASNQQAMAEQYDGHPFILVPAPVLEHCRERLLVTDFVEGRRFAEVRDDPAPERDRYGEILVRFYINGPLRHRLLNGDPHPGNSLFCADGRVAFLDFGFFKRLDDEQVRHLIETARATYDGDGERLMDVVVGLGSLPADPALVEPFLRGYTAIFGGLMADEPLTVGPRQTGDMMREYHRLRGADGLDQLALPAEHTVLLRAVMLMIGQLGQLEATNTWLDIAREWLLDDAPATALGHQEAEFFDSRPTTTRKEGLHGCRR